MVEFLNIKFNHISKKFGTTEVFQDYNLEIKEQETTCIMGPSGSGKTTLIHMLLGLVKPDTGNIEGIKNRRIVAVFQEDRLCETIDAIKNVQIVCTKNVTAEQIEKEFSMVGLTEYKNKPVSQLSGGMRRRVAIVRALMAESDMVIMDEPLKGLDEQLKNQVIGYIKKKTNGKTVIMVTHDKEEAAELSDVIILLE